jgi:hypothetical protein
MRPISITRAVRRRGKELARYRPSELPFVHDEDAVDQDVRDPLGVLVGLEERRSLADRRQVD